LSCKIDHVRYIAISSMQSMLAALKNQYYLFMNYPTDGAKIVTESI